MLRTALLFGAGYVLRTRAGRERYAQIQDIAKKVTRQSARGEVPGSPTSVRT